MTEQIQLRDYQQKIITDIYDAWNAGNRNVLSVLSTGGGKSVIISQIALDGVRKNMTEAIVAHRNELVTQMSCHIARRGIPHRIIGSSSTVSQATRQHRLEFGKSFVHPSAPTAVVGVDTLMARSESLQAWARQVDRWTVDEAHHLISGDNPNKWGKAVQMFSNAYGLGVTATPCRADGQGLGRHADGIFDTMIQGPSMRWLIENQYLADYEIVCPESDLHVENSLVSANGDWSNQTLRKAAKESHITGDVVQSYLKYAAGRRAILFATDVETATEISKSFNDAGIKAASLCAKSCVAVREKFTREFKEGTLQVLINVDLFDEGFDISGCDVVILARPTASLGKYRQQIGRALRYLPNKTAIIIDHVSNVIRHRLPDRPIAWTLDRRLKKSKQEKDPDDIDLVVCRACAKPYEKFRTACPYCGYQKPLPEPRSRSIEMVEGDLVLLDKAALDKLRAATQLEAPADLAARVAVAAGPIAGKGAANRQIAKIASHKALSDAIAQWAGIQRAEGYTDSEIYRKFYLTSGMDVLTALDGSRPGSEIETIRLMVEGWYVRG